MPEPVEYFHESKDGWSAFIEHSWGKIVSSITPGALLIGKPYILDIKFFESVSTELLYSYITPISIIVLAIAITWIMISFKKWMERDYVTARRRHELEHKTRDHLTNLLGKLHLAAKDSGHRHPLMGGVADTPEFALILKDLCENLSVYFQKITGDEKIDVAIRLAQNAPSPTDNTRDGAPASQFHYVTAARSNGLSSGRADSSEPIPNDRGIPRFLKERGKNQNNNSEGVLIYHDLPRAAKLGAYMETQNDEKFPDDIRTMMVSPVNGWNGSACDMIGILYVSSKKKKTFKCKYVDEMLFVADHVAISIASCLEFFNAYCRESNKMVESSRMISENLSALNQIPDEEPRQKLDFSSTPLLEGDKHA